MTVDQLNGTTGADYLNNLHQAILENGGYEKVGIAFAALIVCTILTKMFKKVWTKLKGKKKIELDTTTLSIQKQVQIVPASPLVTKIWNRLLNYDYLKYDSITYWDTISAIDKSFSISIRKHDNVDHNYLMLNIDGQSFEDDLTIEEKLFLHNCATNTSKHFKEVALQQVKDAKRKALEAL